LLLFWISNCFSHEKEGVTAHPPNYTCKCGPMNGLSKSEKTFSSFVIHLFSFLDILLAFASLNINYSPLFPIHFKRNQKKRKKEIYSEEENSQFSRGCLFIPFSLLMKIVQWMLFEKTLISIDFLLFSKSKRELVTTWKY